MKLGYRRIPIQRMLACVTLCIFSAVASAQPDRDSLIDAWAELMRTAPGTVSFERRGDDTFFLQDDSLPYEGEVRIVGVLVRSAEAQYTVSAFTHMGSVEFDLVALPVERRASQTYLYWMLDRQLLYYSEDEQAWLGQADYTRALQGQYGGPTENFGLLSFMLNYGIWIALLALLVWTFLFLGRHQTKAKALIDDSASINEMARKNLERSAELQQESIEMTRQILEIQKANQALLTQIRDNTQR